MVRQKNYVTDFFFSKGEKKENFFLPRGDNVARS